MKKLFLLFSLLTIFISKQTNAQVCIGASTLKSGAVPMQFVEYGANNRVIAGGIYYKSTNNFFTYGGDTLYHNPGDTATVFAIVMDSSLNLIRMFNVIGFNRLATNYEALRIWDMNVDANNNIYFAGSVPQDTIIVGIDTVVTEGYLEAFVEVCDSMGTHKLLKTFGSRHWAGYRYPDRCTSVDIDALGNIYLTGSFEGAYLEINGDTVNNMGNIPLNGYLQGFACSLTPTGQTRWLKAFGSLNFDDSPYSIAVDDSGSAVITGSTEASNTQFKFGPFSEYYKPSPLSYNSFVVKYAPGGVEEYLYPILSYTGNGGDVVGMDIALDNNGTAYAMGYSEGYGIFDGDTLKPKYGYTHAFLLAINPVGTTKFIRNGRIDTFYPFPGKIALSGDKILITGNSYTNQLWFDHLSECCSMEMYFALYDTTGAIQWLKGASTAGSAFGYAYGCTLSPNGTAYACGAAANGQITITPNSFNAAGAPGGSYYLVKFDSLPSTGLNLNITNNTGTDTVLCGGFISLTSVTTPALPSPRYFWSADNDTITTSFPNANFNATPKVQTTYIASAYQNGCVAMDTIVLYVKYLPLVLNSDTTVCNGDSIQLSATNYSTGTYSWTPSIDLNFDSIPNPILVADSNQTYNCMYDAGGCISIASVAINVTQPTTSNYNYTANYLDLQFTNNSTNANKFIWDFGDGNLDSVNANTSHTYLATGTYQICLTASNDCFSETFCDSITVTNVGIQNNAYNGNLVFQQDATSINFKWNGNSNIQQVQLLSSNGKLIYQNEKESNVVQIATTNLAPGIYLTRLLVDGKFYTRKVIVQ